MPIALTRSVPPSIVNCERRFEVTSVADALRPHLPLTFIESPGTLDGGDVLPLV
jgi:hypothetical protein